MKLKYEKIHVKKSAKVWQNILGISNVNNF